MTIEEARVIRSQQHQYHQAFRKAIRDRNHEARHYYRGAMAALERLLIVLVIPKVD